MNFKKILSILSLALLLISCQQKENHPLLKISESTMNRILIFTEEKDELLSHYFYIEDDKIYQMNEDVDIEGLESMIYKPYALSYLFSMSGAGQKIGLTDCQDPFTMIQIDQNYFNKSLNCFSEDEIKEGYQKAIQQEVELFNN